MFGDSTLDALADQAMAANQTVQVSEAAVRQARAQLQQTGAARYPGPFRRLQRFAHDAAPHRDSPPASAALGRRHRLASES